MKSLYIIRHANANKEVGQVKDFDRTLTQKGCQEAKMMALILKINDIKPDLVVSSPAARARETAIYFAEALDYPAENIQLEMGIYSAEPSDLLEIIQQIDDIYHSVLVIGHNPAVSYFTSTFQKDSTETMPTCGIVCIKLDADNWSKLSPEKAYVANRWSTADFS